MIDVWVLIYFLFGGVGEGGGLMVTVLNPSLNNWRYSCGWRHCVMFLSNSLH